MHKLLERQIKKLKRSAKNGELNYAELLQLVSSTYEEIDHERRLRDRAIQLMSDELLDSNRRIRERNELFISAILENIVDGVITLSSTGRIRSMNRSALQIFGFLEQDSLMEKYLGDLFPEDGKERITDLLDKPISRTKDNLEINGLRKNGEIVPLSLSLSPLQLDEKVNYIVILRDISERKNVEKQLIISKEKAEEATEAKARFLSTMSHEIRTPLNAIIGAVNLMFAEEPNESQKEYLDIMKFSSDNLLALINDILDFSKIEEKKITLEEVQFSVSRILDRISEINKFYAKKKGLELHLNYDQRIPKKLIGDPYRITQVLNNLVSNALKFTDFGSVTLDAELNKETSSEARVQFTVEDTGIGIRRDDLDKIFESFSQANIETTRKYGGTGLGLAISRQLVELMGGEIVVKSSTGKGSRFTFEVGFQKPVLDKVANNIDVGIEDADLSGTRILIVEDNKVNRFVVTKFLKKWDVAGRPR